MQIPEYTLSPTATASLEAAFRPFTERTIDGKPLPEWLSRQKFSERNPFPDPALAIQLASTLENVLALENGPEGVQLLEALDGIIHGGGTPGIILHGLPQDKAVAPIIREAFRMLMYADPRGPFLAHSRYQDTSFCFARTGYAVKTISTLHMDDENLSMMFGEVSGNNPRHTMVMTLPEACERIAKATEAEGHPVSADAIAKLLTLPIWPINTSWREEDQGSYYEAMAKQRQAKASELGILRTAESGRHYAPIMYANPAYDARVPDSQPYRLLKSPFDQLFLRMKPDTSAVPAELKDDLDHAIASMRKMFAVDQDNKLKEGPVLREGDALFINNEVLLHSGAGYMHDSIPWGERLFPKKDTARAIVSLDIRTAPEDYPVRPGDRVSSPIRIEHGIARVDPGQVR